MISRDEAERLLEDEGHLFLRGRQGARHDDADDRGQVLRVYLDEYTGWPSFATIAADQAGRETLVALHEAELREQGDGVHVPYDRDRISGAPTVAVDQDLSISEEDALFDYYDVPIDGVTPAVEHLGSVLVPHETAIDDDRPVDAGPDDDGPDDDGPDDDGPTVVEHDVDRATS